MYRLGRGSGVVLVTLVGAVALLPAPSAVARANADPPRDDVYAVFCLAPAHRAEVVTAAVELGTARAVAGSPERVGVGAGPASRTLTVEQWARRSPTDFRRVCSALVAADSIVPPTPPEKDDGGGDGLLTSALLAAVGVALTLLGQFVERGTARRRQRIDGLGTAGDAFALEAERFLTDWSADPNTSSHDEVRRTREELATALRGLSGNGARGRAAGRLAVRLPLAERPGTAVSVGMGPMRKLNRDERRESADELRTGLTTATAEVQEFVASAPRWILRHLRRTAVARLRRPAAGRGVGDT